jgi:hypothetical protein
MDHSEREYPAVHWQRGKRYVDAGSLLTTAGLTSGIDATLHLLEKRNGLTVVEKVTAALHLPASPFVANPGMPQYAFELSDSNMLLNFAFGWPKRRAGIWLYDGVDEMNVTAVIDVYQGTEQLLTVSKAPSVRSRHGLQFISRLRPESLPTLGRLMVPGGGATPIATNLSPMFGDATITAFQNETSSAFAFDLVLKDLAREHDRAIATFAAKRLEVRRPLELVGTRWPLHPWMMLLLTGMSGVVTLAGLSWFLGGTAPAEAYAKEISQALVNHPDDQDRYFHLERAHILGQRNGGKHAYAHWLMLTTGLRLRDYREVLGQFPRILAALVFSRIWVPFGNTGRARVSAFKPMSVPEDLKKLLS